MWKSISTTQSTVYLLKILTINSRQTSNCLLELVRVGFEPHMLHKAGNEHLVIVNQLSNY